MPITITPSAPGGVVGLGGIIHVQSDFIGPLPTGSTWLTQVFATTGAPETRVLDQTDAAGAQGRYIKLLDPQAIASGQDVGLLQENDSAKVTVDLRDNTGANIDVGSGTFKWTTAPTPFVVKDFSGGGSTGGGLTPQQDQTLTETWEGSFPSIAIDSLLTTDLTPGGPSPGPVNAFLNRPVFGVIVRIGSVPAELVPQTPDGDYWVPTLAVVRIFRGSDLWLRVPVHTSSKIVPLESEGLVSAVVAALTNTWMLNLSLQVTFLAGVTGTVLLMNLP